MRHEEHMYRHEEHKLRHEEHELIHEQHELRHEEHELSHEEHELRHDDHLHEGELLLAGCLVGSDDLGQLQLLPLLGLQEDEVRHQSHHVACSFSTWFTR